MTTGIGLPEDKYLLGYYYIGSYVDSNESVTTSGLDTYFTLPQKGFQHARALFYKASNTQYSYIFDIFTTTDQAFGVGGFISSSGPAYTARYAASLSTTMSSAGHFGTNIYLADCYIDDANERIVMSWDSTSGSNTLDAAARFYAAKGSAV